MSRKIIIAGGGSGGHVYPALAIGEGLVELGIKRSDIVFLGSKNAIEKTVIPQAGFELVALPGRGLNKGEPIKNIGHVFQILYACLLVKLRFLFHRPALVIGVGGFASVPALLMASVLRIKRVVHEQNAALGRTNALAAKWGADVITTWENTLDAPARAQCLGLPLREASDTSLLARKEYLAKVRDVFTVTISGGSLGAQSINETIIDLVSEHPELDVRFVHVCGTKHYEKCKEEYARIGSPANVILHSYRDDINVLYARSELVISRAGAGTCVELETLGVQSLLIPLPGAPSKHQHLNAQSLVSKGIGTIMEQSDLSSQALFNFINSARAQDSQAAQEFEPYRFHLDARRRISEHIVQTYLSA